MGVFATAPVTAKIQCYLFFKLFDNFNAECNTT